MGWIIYKNLPAYQICYLLFQMLEYRNQHLTHLSCRLPYQHSKHPVTIASSLIQAQSTSSFYNSLSLMSVSLTLDLLRSNSSCLWSSLYGEGPIFHCQVCFLVCLHFNWKNEFYCRLIGNGTRVILIQNMRNEDKYNILAKPSIKSKSWWGSFVAGPPQCFESRI